MSATEQTPPHAGDWQAHALAVYRAAEEARDQAEQQREVESAQAARATFLEELSRRFAFQWDGHIINTSRTSPGGDITLTVNIDCVTWTATTDEWGQGLRFGPRFQETCPDCGNLAYSATLHTWEDVGRFLTHYDYARHSCVDGSAPAARPEPTVAERLLAAIDDYLEAKLEDVRGSLDHLAEVTDYASQRAHERLEATQRRQDTERLRLEDDVRRLEADARRQKRGW